MVSNKSITNLLLLVALFSFGMAAFWAIYPPQPEGELVFGFTKIPLLTFLLLIALGSAASALVIFFRKREKKDVSRLFQGLTRENIQGLLFISFSFFLIFLWGLALKTPHLASSISEYHKRLKPLIGWGLFVSTLFSGMLIRILIKTKPNSERKAKPDQFLNFRGFLLTFLIILLVAAFIGFTQNGILPIRHWEKNSVPVLFRQVMVLVWGLSGWILLVRPWLYQSNEKNKGFAAFVRNHFDTILFLVIWILAAAIWIQEPLPFNMFSPGGIAPDYVHYPNSDARHAYDLSAQKALIGVQKQSLSKPAYSGFLFLLHLAGGQNYDLLLAIQCVILAVFPALAYLIGKKLYNRSFGLALSFLIVVQTWNAIKGNLWFWNTSHPKLMMTEFPLAVVLSTFLYFMISWQQDQKKKPLNLFCAGAALGVSVLIRDNVWSLIPLPVVLIILQNWKSKKWLWYSLGLIVSFAIIISPWVIQSYRLSGNPIYFMNKLENTIIGDRYLFGNPSENDDDLQPAAQPDPLSEEAAEENSASQPSSADYLVEIEDEVYAETTSLSFPQKLIGHFLHGFVSISFSASPVINFENLYFTAEVNPESNMLWMDIWDGSMSWQTQIAFILNLMVFSLGLSQLWKKQHLLALFPLVVLSVYLFGDGLAFTSGSRYAAPVNWFYYLYYALGIVVVVEGIIAHILSETSLAVDENRSDPARLSAGISDRIRVGFLFFAFILGLMPVVMGYVYPSQYVKTDVDSVLEKIDQTGFYEISEFDKTSLQKLLNDQEIIFDYGKLLYPRFLDFEAGQPIENVFLKKTPDSPFLLFTLLNSKLKDGQIYLLKEEIPENFVHGSDVFVLGCKDGANVEGAYIYLPDTNDLWISDGELCFSY